MIIACIYVFIYYQRLAKSDAYLNELQTENKLLEINNDYIEVLKHQNNEMRMLFHESLEMRKDASRTETGNGKDEDKS